MPSLHVSQCWHEASVDYSQLCWRKQKLNFKVSISRSVSRSFFFIFHLFLVEFLFVFLFINADHVNSATRCDTSLLLDVYNWSCDHILFNDAGNFSRPNVQSDACSTTLTQTLPVSFVFSHFSTSPRSTFKPLLSEEKAWPGTAFMNGLECETAAAGLLRSGSHLKHSVMT